MNRQHGAVLLALVVMLALTLSAALLGPMSVLAGQRGRIDTLALARAREALIAFATSVEPDTAAKRPGDLPCPDLDNDGDAEATCLLPFQRLGRLPWKTLGIADLRDASGERLWYAVSVRFKRNHVNACSTPGGPTCLNSDTNGTLTLRDARGALLHDGTASSGAIALVIAPGAVLTRQGAAAPQQRSCAGDTAPATCGATGRCNSQATALCDPLNYLDRTGPPVLAVAGTPSGEEDNADIVESDAANGFIQGPVLDANGTAVVNDRIVAIRHADVLPALERRVARTAQQCLAGYAASSGTRLPWAASPGASYAAVLADQAGLRFGRLPNTLAASAANPGMSAGWPATCPITWSTPAHKWWANWQNLVFFASAPAHAPDVAAPGCGACLAVSPVAPGADKAFVVVVAGQALAGQIRSTGAPLSAYLEDTNASGGPVFTLRARSVTFNDTVLFH